MLGTINIRFSRSSSCQFYFWFCTWGQHKVKLPLLTPGSVLWPPLINNVWGGCLTSHSGSVAPAKNPSTHLNRRFNGPQSSCGLFRRREKSFISAGIQNPFRPALSQSVRPLSQSWNHEKNEQETFKYFIFILVSTITNLILEINFWTPTTIS